MPRGRRPHRRCWSARRHQFAGGAALLGIMCLLQVAILYMAGPSAIQYLMTMAVHKLPQDVEK